MRTIPRDSDGAILVSIALSVLMILLWIVLLATSPTSAAAIRRVTP
jgi:hypothetical protein